MSARDDYPGDNVTDEFLAALDEIDRLRAQLRTEWTVQEADKDLIRELTKHADTMCDLLDISVNNEGNYVFEDARAAIAAYEEFIKEA